jgi:hypothetical protein
MSLSEISNEFKELLCIPKNYECMNSEDPESREIGLNEYLELVQEQGKSVTEFFKFEIMKLIIFRHIMCFKSNFNSNIKVRLFKPMSVSRLDYPISINEKNYCYNPDDEACRIPNCVIKQWFDNSPELLYSVVKKILVGNGYKTEYEFKDALLKHLKIRGYKYDGFIVNWVNSIVEKSRIYIRC